MTKTELKSLGIAAFCLLISMLLGLKWEKLLIINKNGQTDIQYAASYSEYNEDDEEDEDDEDDEEDEDSVSESMRGSKNLNRNTANPKLKPTFKRFSPTGKTSADKYKAYHHVNERHNEQRTDSRIESGTAQRIYKDGSLLNAFYKFTTFRKDVFTIDYSMEEPEYQRLVLKYGYRTSELNSLQNKHKEERQKIWNENIPNGEAAAKRAIQVADGDYDAKIRALLHSRGLSLIASTKTIEPNVPVIVKKNKTLVKSIARDLNAAAEEKGYGSDEIIGAALSLVQTAILYKIPPLVESNGVHIAGIFPPFRTLLTGWGDCDTKTALVASILSNWNNIKMVGVSVPGHYLMAVRRMPAKGDAFIRYKNIEYVLLEPAGPAWLPPGSIAESTKRILSRNDNYKIEPFF